MYILMLLSLGTQILLKGSGVTKRHLYFHKKINVLTTGVRSFKWIKYSEYQCTLDYGGIVTNSSAVQGCKVYVKNQVQFDSVVPIAQTFANIEEIFFVYRIVQGCFSIQVVAVVLVVAATAPASLVVVLRVVTAAVVV